MCNLAAPWIDAGKLQIIAADSIDRESWDNDGPARPRIEMQERWYNYVCEELTPRALEINREQGPDHMGKVLVGGASMGAGHAVNLFLRRPDLYNGTIALSAYTRRICSLRAIWMTLFTATVPVITCAISRITTHTKNCMPKRTSSLCAAARASGKKNYCVPLAAAGYSGKQGYPSHC